MAHVPKTPSGSGERGPFEPSVYVPPPKEETGAPFPTEPPRPEPLVTEGMTARRRHEERRRREELHEQLRRDEKFLESWGRIRSLALKLGIAAVLVLAYSRAQIAYPDNRWPLELVWALIVVGVFGVFGTTIWYVNRGD